MVYISLCDDESDECAVCRIGPRPPDRKEFLKDDALWGVRASLTANKGREKATGLIDVDLTLRGTESSEGLGSLRSVQPGAKAAIVTVPVADSNLTDSQVERPHLQTPAQ